MASVSTSDVGRRRKEFCCVEIAVDNDVVSTGELRARTDDYREASESSRTQTTASAPRVDILRRQLSGLLDTMTVATPLTSTRRDWRRGGERSSLARTRTDDGRSSLESAVVVEQTATIHQNILYE